MLGIPTAGQNALVWTHTCSHSRDKQSAAKARVVSESVVFTMQMMQKATAYLLSALLLLEDGGGGGAGLTGCGG